MKFFLAVLAFGAAALAVPIPGHQSAGTCPASYYTSTTCGGVVYTSGAVSNAFDRGVLNYVNNIAVNGYPHVYQNYEGFPFPVGAPFLEFPILSSGTVYNGSLPGPDRVVFNTARQYAGAITHTGAAANAFVLCSTAP